MIATNFMTIHVLHPPGYLSRMIQDNSEYHMYAYQQNTLFTQPYIPSYTLADPAD